MKKCVLSKGCLKVSKNLGEHFRSKKYSLKPGSEYYRLLKLAKRYEPLNPSADAELSPNEYLKRKYHSVLTKELDLSPTISQTINSEISREAIIPDENKLNEEEIKSQTRKRVMMTFPTHKVTVIVTTNHPNY